MQRPAVAAFCGAVARGAATATGTAKINATAASWALPTGRSLHPSTSQLNLSRVCHTKTPYTPYTPPNTPLTRATQPLRAPPIPDKALKLSRKVDECKPLPTGRMLAAAASSGGGGGGGGAGTTLLRALHHGGAASYWAAAAAGSGGGCAASAVVMARATSSSGTLQRLATAGAGQGLTLVHFSAQLEPCMTQATPHTPYAPPRFP